MIMPMEGKIKFCQAKTNVYTHLTMTINAHDFLPLPKAIQVFLDIIITSSAAG
jgi:hypothetical protein